MPDYRYVVADLKTGTVRDEVPFTGVTFGQQLSGAPQFSATAPVDLVNRTVQHRLYDALILGDRPVGYWRLGESAGATEVIDHSGNAHDGTYSGDPALEVAGAIADDADTAVLFDAASTARIPSHEDLQPGTTGWSIECWAKIGSGLADDNFVNYYDGTDGGVWLRLWAGTDVDFRVSDGTSTVDCVATTNVDDDAWHHVVGVIDRSANLARVYIDGVQEQTATIAGFGTIATAANFLDIGGMPAGVDEVAVYDRALTAGAVKRHYDRGVLDPKRVVRTHRPLDAIEAARSIVYVERGGIVVGDGIVWDPRKDPGSRDLICQGAGLASYLSRRRIRDTRDYQGVDLGLIAKDLVDWSQGVGSLAYGTTIGPANGWIDIDTSAVAAVGTTHFRTWPGYERKPVADALGELDALEDGLDWWIGVEGGGGTFSRVMRVWHPRRERLTDLVYEWGTNLDDYGVSHQGSLAANLVDAIGQGEGVDMKVATRQDAGVLSAYPLLEDILAMKDVTSVANLADAAGETLRRRATPPVVPTLTLRIGPGTRYGMWALGDRVRVRIDDGWVQVDGLYRIVAWQVSVNDAHDETVTLTVEAA